MKDGWVHKVLMLPWMLPLSSRVGYFSLWLRMSPLESMYLSVDSALTLSLSSALCTQHANHYIHQWLKLDY